MLLLATGCGAGNSGSASGAGSAREPVATATPAPIDPRDLNSAFNALYTAAVEKPSAQQLLDAAWNGLIAEAENEGLDTVAVRKPQFGIDGTAGVRAINRAIASLAAGRSGRGNEAALTYAAIDKMTRSLGDSHTTFLPPNSLNRFNKRDAGNLGTSTGFRLERHTSPPPMVLEVVAGSPAEQAGLQPGDTVVSVDERPIQSYDLTELGRRLEGNDGTKLLLGVRHAGSARQTQITLVRRTISLDIVSSRMLPGNIGYLRIREFPAREFAVRQVDQALGDFADAAVSGIVVDLRGDPGGSVDILGAVLSHFVSQNPLGYTQGRTGSPQPFNRSGSFDLHVPYVVLVDDGSASSAELFAATVQEYGDGLIVGQPTCGCLMAAQIATLPDQRAGLEIAVARVLTPVKRAEVEKHPVQPDRAVAQDPRLLAQGRDPQLEQGLEALNVAPPTAEKVTYAVSQGLQ